MSGVYTVEQGRCLSMRHACTATGRSSRINAQMNRINNLRRHLLSRRSPLIAATYCPISGPRAGLRSSLEPHHELIVCSPGR
jgi:hypothetical protein